MSNNKDFKVKNGIQPTVYHEGLGTVVSGSEGYYLAGASYDGISTQLTATGSTESIFFKPNGLSVYFVVRSSTSRIEQFNLTTAWDLTTISSSSDESIDVGSNTGANGAGLAFSSDGTKMYVSNFTKVIYEYGLSTAWSVSTASYNSVSFTLSAVTNQSTSITFNDSGTKLYVPDYTTDASDKVYQYSLSTAWDASTLSYDNKSFTIGSQETYPKVVNFNSDGTKMYMMGNGLSTVFQYTLSSAYDVSTASYDSVSYDASVLTPALDPAAYSMFLKEDGTKLFISDANRRIYEINTALNTAELDLSTGSVFDYTPTSDIQVTLSNPAASGAVSGATLLLEGGGSAGYDLGNASYSNISFSVSSQDTAPFGLVFNNDGTKMYLVGDANNTAFQYSLSTAFDLSTASYDSVSFSVSGQDTSPFGLAFNNDGTKMYMVGSSSDSVYQYSLSTAFDLSTTSYDSVSFSVFSQEDIPSRIVFNNDGTKMYIVGYSNQSAHQYSLSTAFDLSTASYDSVSFNFSSQATHPFDLTFNNDGTKLFMTGIISKSVYQYSLSTAFDLSTTSYDSVSFDLSGQDGVPRSLAFSNDGTKMYMVGHSGQSIYQYSTATPATITYDTAIEWPSGTAPTSPAIGETDIITFNTTDGGTTYKSVLAIDGAK